VTGGLKDKSIAGLTTGSTAVVTANKGRNYLLMQNVHAKVDIWLNPLGGTAAPNTAGSLRLVANGGYIEWVGPFVPSNAMTARSASATSDLTVVEG